MNIRLIDARKSPHAASWLRNVYPLYLHDLSEFDSSLYTLDEGGLWEPDYLPYWLSHDFCSPHIIQEGSERIGFALTGKGDFPFKSSESDFRIAEFFILRAFRGQARGRAAAGLLLNRFEGKGELEVLPRNVAAAAFWRTVLSLPRVTALEETRETDSILFRFRTGPR